jgi:two-component system cell cycle sensor histidine kinase/response regulator CckA
VVRQAGGDAAIESAVGAGTTVHLWFPAADPVEQEKVSVSAADPGGLGTVLVVEDEASVRRLVGRILTRAGHPYLLAADGREALELVADAPARIRLVITDMVMPGLDGLDLLRELRQWGVDAPAIVVSGYTERFELRADEAGGDYVFLPKPFSREQLLAHIREALGRSGGA